MTVRPPAAHRAVALVTMALVAVVAAFTLGASPAVASPGSLAGTRVAASTHDLSEGVGPAGHVIGALLGSDAALSDDTRELAVDLRQSIQEALE